MNDQFLFSRGEKWRNKPDGEYHAVTKNGLFIFEEKPSSEEGLVELSLDLTLHHTKLLTPASIVAVHGLDGDAYHSWRADNGKIWLRDFLPSQVQNARVMSYGYNSVVTFSKSIGDVDDSAIDLLTRVMDERETPQALIYAHNHSSHYDAFLHRVRGIVFMGTPHRGSDIAHWAGFAARALRAAQIGTGTNNNLLRALEEKSRTLLDISQQFVDRGATLQIRTFYEIEKLGFMNCLIVDRDSAILNLPNEKAIPIQANHKTICKFPSVDDQKYKPVWKAIKNLADELTETDPGSSSSRKPQGQITKTIEGYIKHARRGLERRQQEMKNLGVTPESFDWFTNIPEYIEWSSSESAALLWHESKTESERTMLSQILVTKLIEFCGEQNVTYVFCAESMTAKQVAPPEPSIKILWSVIGQILGRYHDQIDKIQSETKILGDTGNPKELILEEYFDASNVKPADLWELLQDVLATLRVQMHIVIDGIDLMGPNDRSEFLNQLHERLAGPQGESGYARFFITACPEDGIRKILYGYPLIDQDTERKHCLNSLYFSELYARRDRTTDAQHGTNEWILNNPSYTKWLEDKASILWIQGKPGSGKSTLAKTIQNMLFSGFEEPSKLHTGRPQTRDSVVASFFYSSRGGSVETSHKLMLQSLLYQILEQKPYLFELFQQPFRRLRSKSIGRIDWPYDDLKKILLSLVLDGTRSSANPCHKIYLILDAMDESEDQEENGRRRREILSLLSNLCSKEGKNTIKVIIASRPATEIEKNLKRCYHIELQRENSADIEKVVDAGLLSIWRSMSYDDEASNSNSEEEAKNGETKNSIEYNTYMKRLHFVKEYLLKNAAGVILWVTLVINNLTEFVGNGSYSMGEIRERLEAFPSDLGEIYGGIVDRLQRRHSRNEMAKARFMLNWVSFAKRPLTVEEFRDAIASPCDFRPISTSTSDFLDEGRIEILTSRNWAPVRRRMVFMCGNFLEVMRSKVERPIKPSPRIQSVEPMDAVQLLHQTVKDFLMYDERAMSLRLDQIEGKSLITTACISYLMLSLPLKVLQDKPIRRWGQEDYRDFVEYLLDRPLLSYILSSLPQHIRDLRNLTCSRVVQVISELEKFLHQLHDQSDNHAWSFLEMWCLKERLVTDPPVGSTTWAESFMANCLTTASRAGHTGVVKSILSARANIESKDSTGEKALQLAAGEGHDAVVKVLLEKGADPETRNTMGQTPLLWAAKNGRDVVVKLLLENRVDPESKGTHDGRTALSWAAQNGHDAVVKLLLENRVDPESKDTTSRTPLSWAAGNGHDVVVKLLLENRVEPESKDNASLTPLSWAAGNGHGDVVKLLLDKEGIGFNSKDINCGRTALSWAAKNGHEAVVQLLLDKDGIDFNCKDTQGRTALSLAAENGHETAVQLLLDKEGIDFNSKDANFGRTALSWAAENGHGAVVQQLLDKDGTDFNCRDAGGWTALSLAVGSGHGAVAQMLLNKEGIYFGCKGTWGRTALSRAAQNGRDVIVKLLLENKADPESKDTTGLTPLLWAANNGHDSVVKLLLENRADPESKCTTGRTPLSWAAKNGHDVVVKLLLEKDANLESKDIHDLTPLSYAARNGHNIVVELLLEKSVDSGPKDLNHQTPLSRAAEMGHDVVVKLLLERDANLESTDAHLRTPLSWAAKNGHGVIVKLLLEKDANLECKDARLRTPLSWAAKNGHGVVVKLLLGKGADSTSKDTFGCTPLSLAKNNGQYAATKLLKPYQALPPGNPPHSRPQTHQLPPPSPQTLRKQHHYDTTQPTPVSSQIFPKTSPHPTRQSPTIHLSTISPKTILRQ
ncbi:hypothetical protein GP486_003804 [Trichoglossum hirsutum]|uniref:NACHT domain-containing protein n=1 Tax=Trichoglossum hirsutum TaxID=265104 RepID=A0A9P8LC88_9PEZI|nr:hypothetical protein GP486_003804 [Trichoglossum hirsutum]